MATTEEIGRRVEEADTARSAKRSAAARQVGELARRRSTIADELEDIERQLGDVLAAATDVIDVDELARFTDVPASDLTRWLAGRKTVRSKRKKPAGGVPGPKGETRQAPSPAPAVSRDPLSAVVPADTAPTRVPAPVT